MADKNALCSTKDESMEKSVANQEIHESSQPLGRNGLKKIINGIDISQAGRNSRNLGLIFLLMSFMALVFSHFDPVRRFRSTVEVAASHGVSDSVFEDVVNQYRNTIGVSSFLQEATVFFVLGIAFFVFSFFLNRKWKAVTLPAFAVFVALLVPMTSGVLQQNVQDTQIAFDRDVAQYRDLNKHNREHPDNQMRLLHGAAAIDIPLQP